MNKGKWIASLLAISMLAALNGCSNASNNSSTAEESSTTESSIEESNEAEDSEEEPSKAESSVEESSEVEAAATDAEFAVELLGTSISADYEDEPVLVVEYNFTNNSDDAASFILSCQDKAFQNGIECDSTVIGCDEIDSQQSLNEIQPGTTYALKIGYHLQDTTSPVDIEVTSLDFINEEVLLQQTVTLQ